KVAGSVRPDRESITPDPGSMAGRDAPHHERQPLRNATSCGEGSAVAAGLAAGSLRCMTPGSASGEYCQMVGRLALCDVLVGAGGVCTVGTWWWPGGRT